LGEDEAISSELIALLMRALVLAESEGAAEISLQHLRAACAARQPDSWLETGSEGLQPAPRMEKPLSHEAAAQLEEAVERARAEGDEPLRYLEESLLG
jgi:nucleotide-binding universal stress UspA family protein